MNDENNKSNNESLLEEVEELTSEDIERLAAPVKSAEEDDVFKLQINSPNQQTDAFETRVLQKELAVANVFMPHPRRSMFLQYHKSVLYMYGGKFEDKDDKEITLNDLYSLNLKRCDEWACINEDKEFKLDQLKKSMESSGEYMGWLTRGLCCLMYFVRFRTIKYANAYSNDLKLKATPTV